LREDLLIFPIARHAPPGVHGVEEQLDIEGMLLLSLPSASSPRRFPIGCFGFNGDTLTRPRQLGQTPILSSHRFNSGTGKPTP
jgi:hypothetical protein